MTKQTVDIGSAPDDGTGDPARTAFDKLNDNFDEVYGVSGLLKSNGTDTLSAVTAPSGAIVGTTDTQTLTNKTLTTPVIAQINDANGNEALTLAATASAVNYLEAVNSATGNDVSLDAKGGDTNIGIALNPKGAGNVTLGTLAFDADQSIGATEDDFVLTYDDATGLISLEAASGGGSPGGSDGQVQYNNGGAFGGANVWVEDANTLALRNGANAQTLQVYNTFTDASNYERGVVNWNSNVLEVGTEKAGTGSVRKVALVENGNTILQSLGNNTLQILAGSVDIRTFGGNIYPQGSANGLGNNSDSWTHLYLAEQSSDPTDPNEGRSVIWQSDGTGLGDDGDIMMKIQAGGVVKTATLVDFSAI